MKRLPILYPFLFTVYAVLGVYANNSEEVPVQWVFRPLIVALILVGILFYILKRKFKDEQRAALVTTLVLFWFFFGHIHRFLSERSPFWSTPVGTLLAFGLWTIPLVMLGSKWTWDRITNREFITNFFNITSMIVVLLPIYITGKSVVETIYWSSVFKEQQSEEPQYALSMQSSQPDVYLLILDAYGREDFLRETYGFDNHEFIDDLKDKRFYVADQSSPNYPLTWLSLTSLLNYSYVDQYTDALKDSKAHGPVYDLLHHSEIRGKLHDVGYEFVALPSATLFTQMRDADVYYKMNLGDLNEFEGLLLSSTVANIAIDALDLNIPVPSYDLHRRYLRYTLDTLKTVPELKGPKFVFAHFMAPHPPFVFDENGKPIASDMPYNMGDAFSGFSGSRQDYMTGYIHEVQFMNREIMDVIDTILARSEQPPIIIIQGDHGPGIYYSHYGLNTTCLKERYSILNAYYFPDQNYGALYPTITPVNSFRVVLNQYFGTDLPLLDDRSYYSKGGTPFIYQDVTDRVGTCTLSPKDGP
jgi:hypothetical protein